MIGQVRQPLACEPLGVGELWSDNFCVGSQQCAVGDVNNDGASDIIAFIHNPPEVRVALSNGGNWGGPVGSKSFGSPQTWSTYFCTTGQKCAVADVDGQNGADLIVFTESHTVWVALSNGSNGFGAAQQWSGFFCNTGEDCYVADVNADGKADLLAFVKNTQTGSGAGDVWVGLSNGSGFGAPQHWLSGSNDHCINGQTCAVGDVNGDGRADILAFVKSTQPEPAKGDVWVRLALPGGGFSVQIEKWHDYFCVDTEQCTVADINADGQADLLAFTNNAAADVWYTHSNGLTFNAGANVLNDNFCRTGEVCSVGDFNADRVNDLIAFVRSSNPSLEGDVYVSLSEGGVCSSEGRVWLDPSHVASSGAGTPADPILVNRDNPWFQGWFATASNNEWTDATGTYAHQYTWSDGASGLLKTIEWQSYTPSASQVDDWNTQTRGLEGYFESSDGFLNWRVRSGNLIQGNLYALMRQSGTSNKEPVWYKLDDTSPARVMVVPVIIVSWDNAPDYQELGRNLFDFIPFKGSLTASAPWSWNYENTAAPGANYDPPDDIWTQCGIQFQVLDVFRFSPTKPLPTNCAPPPNGRNWSEDNTLLNDLILPELIHRHKDDIDVGTLWYTRLIEELRPFIVEFGNYVSPTCNNVGGKTDTITRQVVEINLAATLSSKRHTVAHELGHILLGGGHYDTDPAYLMTDGAPGTLLDWDRHCTIGTQFWTPARYTAGEQSDSFGTRFASYNSKIGRVSPQNPASPAYPCCDDPSGAIANQSCCQASDGSRSWAPASACLGFGSGWTIVPNAACTDCCKYSATHAGYVGIGRCDGEILADHSQCDKKCCEVNQQCQWLPALDCSKLGQPVVDSCCNG